MQLLLHMRLPKVTGRVVVAFVELAVGMMRRPFLIGWLVVLCDWLGIVSMLLDSSVVLSAVPLWRALCVLDQITLWVIYNVFKSLTINSFNILESSIASDIDRHR
jgi:hypothetical protein